MLSPAVLDLTEGLRSAGKNKQAGLQKLQTPPVQASELKVQNVECC